MPDAFHGCPSEHANVTKPPHNELKKKEKSSGFFENCSAIIYIFGLHIRHRNLIILINILLHEHYEQSRNYKMMLDFHSCRNAAKIR